MPKSTRERVVAVVGVADLTPRSERVNVQAYGTLVAARQIDVQPEVTGRIIQLHPHLQPGGLLRAAETLFEIDPADYVIAVDEADADIEVARAQVERLEASVDVSKSRVRQVEAELEYLRWNAERLGGLSESDLAGESESRDARMQLSSQEAALSALRAQVVQEEHSVQSARAQLQVARSRLAAAQLALGRTHVEAPFDAIVLTENVEPGQLVTRQSTVATLAATDEFWVEASVPVARLRDIRFAERDMPEGSSVNVTLVNGEASVGRTGRALRPLGQLDPRGRMARILVSIQDPLGLNDEAEVSRDALLLGSYVHVSIDAGALDDVYVIPRYALRENDRVWVRDANGQLDIRPVQIVWRRQDDLLVRNGFKPGDQLVTTHLASVIPGMPLDVRQPRNEGVADHDDTGNHL